MMAPSIPGFRRDASGRSLAFFAESPVVAVTAEVIAELKAAAQGAGGANVRLCMHASPEDNFHDMLILEHRGSRYFRPHRHGDKSETLHAIEGEALVLVFGDDGAVVQRLRLAVDGARMVRVGAGQWHTVLPLSPSVLYHEAKRGPFVRDGDAAYPSWAPNGSDFAAAAAWTAAMMDARA